jgi:hypothetical protein
MTRDRGRVGLFSAAGRGRGRVGLGPTDRRRPATRVTDVRLHNLWGYWWCCVPKTSFLCCCVPKTGFFVWWNGGRKRPTSWPIESKADPAWGRRAFLCRSPSLVMTGGRIPPKNNGTRNRHFFTVYSSSDKLAPPTEILL